MAAYVGDARMTISLIFKLRGIFIWVLKKLLMDAGFLIFHRHG
jgi:hypothetical protein